MAEKIVSPGVFTSEVDKTFLPAAVAEIGGAVIGPTVKGPVLTPTVVTSYSEYQAMFGDSFLSGSNYYSYMTSIAAKNYLKNANKLTVVRILAGNYSEASATISSSIDPYVLSAKDTGSLPAAVTSSLGITNITFATGSFSIDHGAAGNGSSSLGSDDNNQDSMSILYNSNFYNFVFTGSKGAAENVTDSGADHTYYIITGSTVHPAVPGLNNIFGQLAEVINNSSSIHGLPITASYSTSVLSNHILITASFWG